MALEIFTKMCVYCPISHIFRIYLVTWKEIFLQKMGPIGGAGVEIFMKMCAYVPIWLIFRIHVNYVERNIMKMCAYWCRRSVNTLPS